MFGDSSVFGVLLDPPDSVNQLTECFKSVLRKVTNKDTEMQYYSKIQDEVNRILIPSGKVITCGWNSRGWNPEERRKCKKVEI